MALHDLVFSDLFVTADPATCWYKETQSTRDGKPIPDDCLPEIAQLRAVLLEDASLDGAKLDWQGDGTPPMRLRVQRMETVDEGPVFVCRRPSVGISSLAALGFPPAIVSRLLAQDMRDGLIIFMGRTAAGKTTSAAAYVVEYVSFHGGVCWAIESPAELPLHGRHGRGRLYQVEVATEHDYGPAIRRTLRAMADLMLIGEIRDNEAATEAVLAGTTGHLVTTTFHAQNVTAGLERFANMCGSADSLASALRAVIYLQLRTLGATPDALQPAVGVPGKLVQPKRVLSVTPLLVPGETADSIRSHIRAGQFHQLASEVDRQRRSFMQSGAA